MCRSISCMKCTSTFMWAKFIIISSDTSFINIQETTENHYHLEDFILFQLHFNNDIRSSEEGTLIFMVWLNYSSTGEDYLLFLYFVYV